MSRKLATALCASLTVLATGVTAPPAAADAMMSEAAPSRIISVPKDKSLSFRLDEPATKIVVAQPDIAEVVATTDRSFYVRGIDLGSTNLLVYGPGGRLMEVIDVRVGPDAAALQQDIAQALPAEHVKVSNLGQGVMLTGTVSNSGAALRAKAIAERQSPDGVTSMLRVTGAQVVLEVRILEANRSVTQDMGLGATFSGSNFNFTFGSNLVGAPATPPGGQPPLVGLVGNSAPSAALRFTGRLGSSTVDAQIAALEEKGTVRTLARPNLVALSGEKASFLAGGEFPFPVPAGNNNVTIEFRPYGVKLNFTPTIQDDGTIRLLVEPEVSALDPTNSLKLNGVTVPALTVRRANTTVELKNGDSLAIGGLFQHGYENELRQIPGLGEIPILSALFRSTHYKRNESELLIIVTPRMQTQGDLDTAKNRVISGSEPAMFDFMVKGKALDKPMAHDWNGPVAAPSAAVAQNAASAPKAAVVQQTAIPSKAAVTQSAAATPKAAVAQPAATPKATAAQSVAPAPKAPVVQQAATPPKVAATQSAAAAPKADPAQPVAAPSKVAMTQSAAPAPKAAVPQPAAAASPKPAVAQPAATTTTTVAQNTAAADVLKAAVLQQAATAPTTAVVVKAATPATAPTPAPQLRGSIAPTTASSGK